MKTICKVIGGSHMYGLNTPESDYDERYIFIHDDIARTIGLERFEHHDERGGADDRFGFELRHYMNLLRKTNTQVLEIVYAESFLELDASFKKYVINERNKLIDTKQLFRTLMGYIQGERALMTGERTGTLGKRKEAISKYGYSYKNATQLFRLAHCGCTMFLFNYFPTNIKNDDARFHEWLMDIKLHPEKHTRDEMEAESLKAEQALKNAFDGRDVKKDFIFDVEYANWVLLKMYGPIVQQLYHDNLLFK